jgi:hypothetical protein
MPQRNEALKQQFADLQGRVIAHAGLHLSPAVQDLIELCIAHLACARGERVGTSEYSSHFARMAVTVPPSLSSVCVCVCV